MTRDSLERRDLLRLAGGAAVVGATASTGCASTQRDGAAAPPASPEAVAGIAAQLDPAAADALLAKIDARMRWIEGASLPEDVLPLSRLPRGGTADAESAATGRLVRSSIRSLYLTGRFLDMPDTMKVHPGMQARLAAIQPEMDDAVFGMTERLERLSPDDHRRVQAHLQKDRLFGERLARTLEKTAADDGLSFQRTFGVRTSTLELSRRMADQSPALVIDPLVRKVRRIQAHPRTDAESSRLLAARVGEDAFWAHQQRLALLHRAWESRLGSTTALATTGYTWPTTSPPPPPSNAQPAYGGEYHEAFPTPPAPATPRRSGSSPGGNTVRSGGIVMGFGLGSVAVGLILGGIASAAPAAGLVIPALVFGVTIGPILLVVGLVIVIVGLAMKASE